MLVIPLHHTDYQHDVNAVLWLTGYSAFVMIARPKFTQDAFSVLK